MSNAVVPNTRKKGWVYNGHFSDNQRGTEGGEMAGGSRCEAHWRGLHDPLYFTIQKGGHRFPERWAAPWPGRAADLPAQSGREEGAGSGQHRGAREADGRAEGEDSGSPDPGGSGRPLSPLSA